MRSAAWPSQSSGTRPCFAAAGKDFVGFPANRLDVAADHRVGALLDGDRTFGVFAQREAGNAERGGFFLQAAGIGEHERAPAIRPSISR